MTALAGSMSRTMDFLRGFSAQIVVFGHAIGIAAVANAIKPPTFPFIQNIGVIIFFFLSGFVISMTVAINLSRKTNYDYIEFVIDRGIRFTVTMLPCLLVVAIIDSQMVGNPIFAQLESSTTIKHFIGNLLMLQNHPWLPVTPFGSGRPFWSIAVEWWIYMFFGYFILVAYTSPLRLLLGLPLFLAALPFMPHYLLGGRGLALVWLFGAFTFLIIRHAPRISGWARWLFMLVAFAAITPYLYDRVLSMNSTYNIPGGLAIGAFMAMILYISSHVKPISKLAPLGIISHFIARYSFTLYCLHYSVIYILKANFGMNGWTLVAYGFFLSNVLSIVVAWMTEFRYPAVRRYVKRWLALLRLVESEQAAQRPGTVATSST